MNATTTPLPRLSPEEIDTSLDIVKEVFRQFRPIILERAGNIAFTDKQDGSPVTETDMEVEVALQAALSKRFPGVPVYGEETGYTDGLTGAFWLVDPIDGTSSFIKNVPTFTSMAALIQDGETVASIIYNISTNDMYTAQKGQGAYKNDTRLDLAKAPLSGRALCKGRFFEALNKILEPKKVVCENGPSGGGYGFSVVADGRFAARFNLDSRGYTHDYAPGALLVREAGGAIIPVQENTYTYETRSFIACHPELEPVLRPHVQAIRELENKTQ